MRHGLIRSALTAAGVPTRALTARLARLLLRRARVFVAFSRTLLPLGTARPRRSVATVGGLAAGLLLQAREASTTLNRLAGLGIISQRITALLSLLQSCFRIREILLQTAYRGFAVGDLQFNLLAGCAIVNMHCLDNAEIILKDSLKLLPRNVHRVGGIVVSVAVGEHEAYIRRKFVRRGVLLDLKFLPNRPQVHWPINGVRVAGDVDGLVKPLCNVKVLLVLQLVNEICASGHLLLLFCRNIGHFERRRLSFADRVAPVLCIQARRPHCPGKRRGSETPLDRLATAGLLVAAGQCHFLAGLKIPLRFRKLCKESDVPLARLIHHLFDGVFGSFSEYILIELQAVCKHKLNIRHRFRRRPV
eukprot:Opistho-2@25418